MTQALADSPRDIVQSFEFLHRNQYRLSIPFIVFSPPDIAIVTAGVSHNFVISHKYTRSVELVELFAGVSRTLCCEAVSVGPACASVLAHVQ